MKLTILDINETDILAMEKEQINGPLSYLADFEGVDCYCEEEAE